MKTGVDRTTFSHARTGRLFFYLVAIAMLLIAAPAAWAANCLADKAGRSLTCTANDVRIASAGNIRNTDGTPLSSCISGQTFSFIADFNVVLSATARYDIGLWFATDGDSNNDGALSGTCSVNIIQHSYLDPASPNAVMLGTAFEANLDNDTCRDITTANGWGPPNGRAVTVRVDNVLCQDTDGDGKLNLPNCTSWSQNSGVVCSTANDTVPGSPSKCSCDKTFNIGIRVDTPTASATKAVKTGTPSSLPEPGGEFTYAISFTNTSQFVSVTLDRICDDRYGTIKYNAGPACSAGTIGAINATTCALPQTLAVGATYSCEFTANFTGDPGTLTDTVTFFGHDSNVTPKPIQASASAQVAISDVAPAATVAKSLVGLACADVDYHVKVTNTSTAESLTLSALTDSAFGSITSVHDAVLSTTCSVPQTLAKDAVYECGFRAHFCGGSHTDTVTAKMRDNENPNTDVSFSSDPLTVNVGAEQQP